MRRFIPLSAVRIDDVYMRAKQKLVRDTVITYQWDILNDRVPDAPKSHCIENFKIAAGRSTGSFEGAVFQDTDLYKWLEAVAYSLEIDKDAELEARADDAIGLIAEAQCEDGYLDTYYIISKPDERWTNLMEGHELYCAGHMIEAAVAYERATGKGEFTSVARRFADCIDRTFGWEDGKCHGYPGHPEIEVALIRLYELTRDEKYLRLAQYFVDARASGAENYFEAEMRRPDKTYIWPEMERFGLGYFQAEKPLREQDKATGHAVRAMYLYSAMADLARITGDPSLAQASERLFHNVTERQMYVTGAIGSAAFGERFTCDFDLPNDLVYGETCASIGLMMWARRMFMLNGDLRAYDTWERALMNTVLAGMGRDGRHFFYVNPLCVNPEIGRCNPALEHVKSSRQAWFGVACCPPNLARTIMSLGESLYAVDDGALYVLAHMASSFAFGGITCSLHVDGDRYTLALDAPPMAISLRRPDGFEFVGESEIVHPGGRATYTYRLRPITRFIWADPRVPADVGKVCVMRGATVYCAEQIDNAGDLGALMVDTGEAPRETAIDSLPRGECALVVSGWRLKPFDGALYESSHPEGERTEITLVPYREWNNRGEGQMTVWLHELRRATI